VGKKKKLDSTLAVCCWEFEHKWNAHGKLGKPDGDGGRKTGLKAEEKQGPFR